jgi:hypothetical protein
MAVVGTLIRPNAGTESCVFQLNKLEKVEINKKSRVDRIKREYRVLQRQYWDQLSQMTQSESVNHWFPYLCVPSISIFITRAELKQWLHTMHIFLYIQNTSRCSMSYNFDPVTRLLLEPVKPSHILSKL